jgi:hypothetical protein
MSRLALWLTLGSALAGCTGAIGDVPDGKNGISPTGGTTVGTGTSGATGSTGATGTSGSTGTSTGTGMPPDMKPPSAQPICPADNTQIVGHRTLRRLTNAELETTIRAAFALDIAQWPGANLPTDTSSTDGFTNNVDALTVGNDYAAGVLDAAKKVGTLVSTDPLLTKLLPCATTGNAACADTFVSTFGAKLYRRPLTTAEKARYTALYTKVSAQSDFKTSVYWATVTMLQSPSVIYRSEIGTPNGAQFKLDAYEIASQLSYTFSGAPPATDLTQLAATNQLQTADQIETAARALVFDGQTVKPAFRDLVLHFTDQWLGLTGLSNLKKDAMLFPDYSADVQDAMGEETKRFLTSVIFDDRGSVKNLLSAPYTFVDPTLAKYYGFGAATGTTFVRADRPASWGVGLLAQGSMLSVQANSLSTSPTRRGHLVRTRLLCDVVPPPPPVVGPISPPSETQTTRQRYEMLHESNASCKGCHQMMDWIGFGFEHLDAAGRYRALENKFEIDDSATVLDTSAGDLKVKGPTELATALSTLPEVNDCVAAYMAAYALGVTHESAACLVRNATAELRSGTSLVDFYVRMARADHFRARQ